MFKLLTSRSFPGPRPGCAPIAPRIVNRLPKRWNQPVYPLPRPAPSSSVRPHYLVCGYLDFWPELFQLPQRRRNEGSRGRAIFRSFGFPSRFTSRTSFFLESNLTSIGEPFPMVEVNYYCYYLYA
ncbi:hypothetical protein FIBSPDRAFT_111130 [Athelia psychrophila]|uniref:Uncharacterized protein n=1 Tax=Athelia psychrophila TaxID=1759441 RepID=A0A166TEM7_9AGAM|nr:hypothetical protein FIBSPDRAFT_111130 [Fibularhizoctonia sp. CBS 109695]